MIYGLLRPALFALDPERAHALTIGALSTLPPGEPPVPGPLASTVAGITFPNPVGLAAGFDKDAAATDALFRLGFGFVEVGTIPPLPQPGNPKPRLFRLAEDRAVINRFGFNSGGSAAAAKRLEARAGRPGVVGVNIGANKDAADRVADYAAMARLMAPLATYLTVNVSSPNTPGLRALQDPAALAGLLDAVIDARDASGARPPIFLKVAPDLMPADIDAIARIALDKWLGAVIIGNTTVSRPALRSASAGETGGLSGAPLAPLALERLRDFRKASGGDLPLVAAGGIDSAAEAWRRIRAGASLVQIYSAMVYEGPFLARRIARELAALMRRDGFASLAEAIGTEERSQA